MNGNPDVLRALQAALALEAQLNLKYRLDWRVLKFNGLKKLVGTFDKFGDDAHCWMKAVTDRILFLGGDPSYAVAGAMTQSPNLTGMVQADLALELAIVEPYERAVQIAMQALDDTSRNLFEHLLKWHEKHVGRLEQILRLIDGLGEEEFIAEQL